MLVRSKDIKNKFYLSKLIEIYDIIFETVMSDLNEKFQPFNSAKIFQSALTYQIEAFVVESVSPMFNHNQVDLGTNWRYKIKLFSKI